MTAAVTAQQRHTRAHRCPICDGADGDPRGKGKRCSGFTSADGEYVHCSREELAGGIEANGAGLYAHRMRGECRCGQTHGPASNVRALDTIEAVYPYTDERGTLLFEVVRKSGKRFLQRRPDGASGWDWSTRGVRRVLYRLLDLVEDDADRTVYLVEGERDVETLRSRGFLATCNPGGAGKWSMVAEHAREVLRGRDVVVIADRDEVGRKHALEVANSLRSVTRSVVVRECPAPHKDSTDLFCAGGSVTDLVPLASDSPAPSYVRLAERVRARIGQPPPLRLPTGVATFDNASRGGLVCPRVVVVGGAPGAGKTSIVIDWGHRWAAAGIPVVALAVDEGVEGYESRLGLRLNLDQDALDRNDSDALGKLARHLESLPFEVVDEEQNFTIETAAELLSRMPSQSGARVLLIDSAQTAPASGTDEATSPRERVDRVMRACKLASKKHGLLVVVTSELARGFYRSRNTAEAIDPLAAFKESGGIEYGAATALVLRTVKGDGGLVDVLVPKHRGYRRDPFRLRLNRDMTFTEVPIEDDEDDDAKPRRGSHTNISETVNVVRRILLTRPGVAGKGAMRGLVRAEGHVVRHEQIDAAIDELRRRGELEERSEKGKPRWFYRHVVEADEGDD